MDRPKKYERFRYSQETLQRALQSIINGTLTMNKASVCYNIPKSTLHNKLTNKVPWERKMGPPTELSSAEEAELAQWIIDKAKLGFPMHSDEVIDSVENYLNANKRQTKFTSNRPGQKWLELFLKRHPEISKQHAEMISKARAAVTEEGIRKWFEELEEYLIEENALDIKSDPTRIFNTDETGVVLCPKSGQILGPKNYRNIYEIAHGKEKESITVLCTFSADGNNVPPFVVYPYKRMPPAIAKDFPDSWFIGRSDSGWMVTETFFAYIKLFKNWLVENKIKLPIILFMDGHKSHINREMFEFCKENRILLFCLHPNATHILQPCDVGVFGPLKKSWKKVVRKYKQATTAPITKLNFASIFKKSYDLGVKPETIRKSFRACGLFPVNADAVDYSKCINTRRHEISERMRQNDNLTEEYKEDMRSTLKVIENEIDRTTRNQFVDCYKVNKPHDHTLYALWAKCRAKLDNKINTSQNRDTEATENEAPLDLSNTSSIDVSLNRTNNSESNVENRTIIETVALIHADPDISVQNNQNNVKNDNTSTSINVTNLFHEGLDAVLDSTEDIINFIVDQDASLTRICTPPHNTVNCVTYTGSEWGCNIDNSIDPTSNICNISASTECSSPSILITTPETNNNLKIQKEIPIQELNTKINTMTSETDLAAAHIDNTDNNDVPLFSDSSNDNSASPTTRNPTVDTSNPTSLKLKDFLHYPEITSKKTNPKLKKEPVPFGLTGLKCKEYFAKQDQEKKKKEEELEKRKKKKIDAAESRKRKLEIKKETQTKNNQKEKTKAIPPKPRKILKKDKIDQTVSSNDEGIVGKYVIVSFKTEKRTRYFAGKVLMADNNQQKYKIDFLRKKSVSNNIVTFVRPHVPDVTEVDFANVHRILNDPIVTRRGFMSFADVSFKDIE